MSRTRYLLILAAPFISLTLVPIGLIVLMRPYLPGEAVFALSLLALLNGAASAGDLLAVYLIATQVPVAALVRSQGPRLFWKRP